MSEAVVKLPPKLLPLFGPPRGSVQYRAAHGGRGSGKSFNFAKMAAIWGMVEPLRVLITREFQSSVKESFHAELKAAIADEPWLSDFYDVGEDYLRSKNRQTDFIFRGLRQSVNTIKSLARIDLTIVEEAEDIPESSWLALEATVFRQPKSELWPIWNPRLDGSPVDLRFRKNPPPGALVVELNYNDNPFFPPNLETLRQHQQKILDQNTYDHIWNGAYLINSVSQVMAGKWRIAAFDIDESWDGPYQGGDFGFSVDPTAAVRVYIDSVNRRLMISHEAGKVGLELDDYVTFFAARIPWFQRYKTRWDSARPESISHIQKHGLPNSESVDKWPGSIEDGIAFMRSFDEIVIHERCVEVAKEMRFYSYKVDRHTGDVLPVLIDSWNHYIDAIRYALAPLIRRQHMFPQAVILPRRS